MSSKEGKSLHYYVYYFENEQLEEYKGIGNKTKYYCRNTNSSTIREKCNSLRKKCIENKARFEGYLGNYNISDILMK